MQTRHLAAALCLLALISPGAAAAVVVVRHPVYVVPHAVVVVPPVVVVTPPPVVVVPPPPQPPQPAPPPPLTTELSVNTTMWALPSNCMKVSVNGQTLFQCGPNWLKQLQSDKGPYYAVVPAPQ